VAGVFPNLDASDLEARVRTYLNEATADFYSQAEIWRWLSLGVKDIAQRTNCVRRILDAQTTASTRTVTTNVYKVLHVEYVPSTGRSLILPKISPLQVGHKPLDGVTPQYWYEFGSTIGIEPIPSAIYSLRLYVSDIPKMCHSTYPIATFSSGWTGTGTGTWTNGTTAAYVGTTGQIGINTYGTSLAASTNYTFTFTLSGISNCGVVLSAGTTDSISITTNGIHTVNLTSSSGTPALKFTATMTGATGGVTVDDLYILKEADFGAVGDQTELPTIWQGLLALYSTYNGLIKDKRIAPAQILESIYRNELNYLKANVIDIIPDSKEGIR
jgi:hypothetical protein